MMKKIQLSIQDPCKQDWNAMHPDERGRFCTACHKTVIDFAAMTDRQIAEFFKKPKDNICGRLHADQMNRDILLPRKRIGWLRYFFGFTWPAFMLFLKSCGLRGDETVGQLQKLEHAGPPPPPMPGRINYATNGFVLVDSLSELSTVQEETKNRKKTKLFPVIHSAPLVQQVNPEPVDSAVAPVSCMQNRTQALQAYVGGISYTSSKVVKIEISTGIPEKKINELPIVQSNDGQVKIYPNPVIRNGMVTVDVNKPEQMPERVNLVSSSGQIQLSLQQQPDKLSTVFHFRLPAKVVPGIYFLQMITREQSIHTEKIIIQ